MPNNNPSSSFHFREFQPEADLLRLATLFAEIEAVDHSCTEAWFRAFRGLHRHVSPCGHARGCSSLARWISVASI
jgi:hypothetical protein